MRLNINGFILVFFLSVLSPSVMLGQTPRTQPPSARITNTATPRPHRNLDAAEINDLLRRLQIDTTESPTVVQCAVLNNNGQRVTSIPTTEIGDPSFFLKYASGGVFAQQVTFMTVPLFEGSPLTKQAQVFDLPNPDDTDITTPFGVPVWALDATTGPWLLIVKNGLGDIARCRFTVVP
jgi:hypothetical protein